MVNKVTNARAPGTFTFIPLAIFCVTLLVFWWWITQDLAQSLAYQDELGPPWFHLGGTPVYKPWQFLTWNYYYHYYAEDIFKTAILRAFASGAVGVGAVIIYVVWIARRAATPITYGSAKWASDAEILKSELVGDDGVMLAIGPENRYLRHDGPEHIALVAPPRSKKGVGPINCTMLTWPHSVVLNDIRREGWDATAGWRAKFSNVIYFNPTDPQSAHFNPMFEIRMGKRAIADAQNVADMIVDPDGTGKPDHWDKTSHALLVAAILHILYAEEDKSLPGLAMFLADPARDLVTTLNHMLVTQHSEPDVHRAIASAARENLNRSPNELSGVQSTAMSFLALYRDPIVAGNIRTSDFRVEDLIYGKRPLSLYMVIPPSEINRTRALRRLIWAQIGRKLMEEYVPMHSGAVLQKGQRARRRLLMLCDEFPALGRMDFFETQLAYTGGYGIKTMIVAQSRNQIDKVYGPTNSILDLCHVRIFFAPNDAQTAETISTLTGTSTTVHQQKTYTGHRLAPWLSHVMVADQESARPLMTPGEVLTLDQDTALIFVAGKAPIQARKLAYYDDPNLKTRVLPPPALVDTTQRPYPYRPAQQSVEWANVAAPGATAEDRLHEADDEAADASPDVENAIEAGPATTAATAPARPKTASQDKDQERPEGHELDVEDVRAELDEVTRRAAFDEHEQAREAAKHHRHEPGIDRGI